MSKVILFQWTGFAPRGIRDEVPPERRHVSQASCAAAFPSTAAFLRATGSKRSRMPYIGTHEIPEGYDPHNEGARLAIAHPGTVYWFDDLRNPRKEGRWLQHTDPTRS